MGGTDILRAFQRAYKLMTKDITNKNKIRRMIIITDMEDRVNKELTNFCKKFLWKEYMSQSLVFLMNSELI